MTYLYCVVISPVNNGNWQEPQYDGNSDQMSTHYDSRTYYQSILLS